MYEKGYHILLELYGVNSEILNDVNSIKKLFYDVEKASGLKIVENSFFVHKFMPVGLTAIVLLRTSHISIHTWPQLNFASLDIFACDSKEKAVKTAEFFVTKLKPKRIKKKIIRRGYIVNTAQKKKRCL